MFDNNRRLVELTTHRRYDDNLAHGHVKIYIKHKPKYELRSYQTEESDIILTNGNKEHLEHSISDNKDRKSSLIR